MVSNAAETIIAVKVEWSLKQDSISCFDSCWLTYAIEVSATTPSTLALPLVACSQLVGVCLPVLHLNLHSANLKEQSHSKQG